MKNFLKLKFVAVHGDAHLEFQLDLVPLGLYTNPYWEGVGVSNRGRNKTNKTNPLLVCNSKSKHSNPVCVKHNSNLRHICSWKIVNDFGFCSGTIMFPVELETVPSTV